MNTGTEDGVGQNPVMNWGTTNQDFWKAIKRFISVVSVKPRKWGNCHLLSRSEEAWQQGKMVRVSAQRLVCTGDPDPRGVLFARFRASEGGRNGREERRETGLEQRRERS